MRRRAPHLRLRPPLRFVLLLLLEILAAFVLEYPLSRSASYTFGRLMLAYLRPGMGPGCSSVDFPGTRACASVSA